MAEQENETESSADAVSKICRKLSRKATFVTDGDYFNKPRLKKLVAVFIVTLLLTWTCYRETLNPEAPGAFSVFLAGLALACVGMLWMIVQQIYNGFNDRKFAKEHLISIMKTEVVNSFNQDYQFNPYPAFPVGLYRSCGLFPSAAYDHSYAEDEISGWHDDLHFRLIEIRTEKEIEEDNDRSDLDTDLASLIMLASTTIRHLFSGKRGNFLSKFNENTVEVYRGVVFVTEFAKPLKGTTYVREDKLEGHVGNLARNIQRIDSMIAVKDRFSPSLELIELENPEFEKYFSVTTSDPIESRVILSSDIMERMVDIRETIGSGVNFCFKGTTLIITITKQTDFLDDKADLENIRLSVHRMRREITALTSIISKLKLDQHKKNQNRGNWKQAS